MGLATCVLALLPLNMAVYQEEESAAQSHRRMLAELKRVEDLTPLTNAYLATNELLKEREQLLASDSQNWSNRVRSVYAAGLQELRVGDLQRSVELLEEAYTLLAENGGEGYAVFRNLATYYLGLACLRLGELRNCVTRHTAQSCILPIEGSGVFVETEATEKAIQYFLEYCSRQQDSAESRLAAQWLANLGAMAIGQYPNAIPENHRIDPSYFETEIAFPRFYDVAPKLGINTLDMAGGAAVDDFDGDGQLDLLTSSWDPSLSPTLFLRNEDGGFVQHSEESGLFGLTGGLNLNHADYDNDGDNDVLILRGAWQRWVGKRSQSLASFS